MTPADLLSALLEANLAAGAATLAVAALRGPARPLFGARLAYGLWLLIPAAAAATLAPAHTVLRVAPHAPPVPLGESLAAAAEPALSSAIVSAPSLDPWQVALWVWALGAVAMGALLTRRQASFLREMRAGLAGPAVIGLIRPRIVLPADFEQRYSPREQAVVLAHERAHLARQDARVNAIVSLLRCLCWFNPLIHAAAHLMRVDQELACDAAVMARHPRARKPYAQALLKAQMAAGPLPLGCYWPAAGEHPLTERVALLDRPRPGRGRRLAGGALLLLLALGSSFAAWAAQPARTRYLPRREAEPPPAAAPMLAQAPTPHRAKPSAVRSAVPAVTPAPVATPAAAAAPDLRPSKEQTQAWRRLTDSLEANGALWRPLRLPWADPRGVNVEGTIAFADGSDAPLVGMDRVNGLYRTMFADGAMAVRLQPSGEKILVSALISFSDGRIEQTPFRQIEPGQPVTIALPNGATLRITASFANAMSWEEVKAKQAEARTKQLIFTGVQIGCGFQNDCWELARKYIGECPEADTDCQTSAASLAIERWREFAGPIRLRRSRP